MRGPRPEGTDGSDFSYREVVEDRYKRMAVNMSATLLLHQIMTLVVLVKTVWNFLPLYIDGKGPNIFSYIIPSFALLSNYFFYAGKPRGRCVLTLMKFAALLVLGAMAMQFIAVWKYHVMDPSTNLIPRRLYRALRDAGKIQSKDWLSALTYLEAGLDIATLGALGLCFWTFNNWVKDAMDAAKEVDQRKKATQAAQGANGGGAKKRR